MPWTLAYQHDPEGNAVAGDIGELIDAIENKDDHEMREELGDLLLQVVFHCQLARERGAFEFEDVAREMTEKLLRRHPHVFGDSTAKTVDAVWAQWDQIKNCAGRFKVPSRVLRIV